MAAQTLWVNVKAGATTKALVNLGSLSGLNGTVSLTCATSSAQFSCGMNPASVLLNGATTAGVTITAKVPAQAAGASRIPGWPAGVLAVCCVLGIARKRRALGAWLSIIVLGISTLMVFNGCGGGGTSGGGGGSGGGSNPDYTPAGRYSVVVTATSGTVVHNVRLTVLVE
jgi:hypothetical protein